MRNYIILNGSSSLQINGLLIQSLAPISKPLIRTQVEEIDGRDGDIITPLGFSAYDKEITVGLYGDFDINEIIAFFNSEGVVTFSNEPDKYYNYQIIDQIDFERLVRYRTATVTMHCQPFKYSTTEETETLGDNGTVSGEGSAIVLEDTGEAPFSKLDLKGNATQTTYSGKNLLPMINTTRTINGVTFTPRADGSIALSGTASAQTNYPINVDSASVTRNIHLSAGTYTVSWGSNPASSGMFVQAYYTVDGGSGLYSTGTFTVSGTQATLGAYIRVNNGINTNGTVIYPMLESGSTATAYEPYVGGTASPNPDYPQAVNTVTGEQTVKIADGDQKNIADPQTFIDWANRTYGLCVLYGWGSDANRPAHTSYDGRNNVVRFAADTLYSKRDLMSNPTYLESLVIFSGIFKENTQYTISFDFAKTNTSTASNLRMNYTDGTFNALNVSAIDGWTHLSVYSPAGKTIKNISMTYSSGTTYLDLDTLQIEEGTQASSYEPFISQTLPVNLGKNLLPITATSTTINGTTFTVNSDGSITVSGTPSAQANLAISNLVITPNDNLTISTDNIVTGASVVVKKTTNGTVTYPSVLYAPARKEFTLDSGSTYEQFMLRIATTFTGTATFKFQLEKGSTVTSYAPYFTPYELCKIGNYQDRIYKTDGKWYIEKQVGKLTLTGSSQLNYQNEVFVYNNWASDSLPLPMQETAYGSSANILVISDHYTGQKTDFRGSITTNSIAKVTGANSQIAWNDTRYTTVADMTSWLASNPTTVYYALATPVDEEITNETLIGQLEAIDTQAHAYKGRTHVTALAATGNAPHIIAAEVQTSSDGTVTNSGNYFSKPKLTIYGSGNIGVYLNGYQVFEIALGDEDHITIDTAAMEAYKDTLDNLKNRLVTGDYNNFALKVGENEITFSGIVSKCIVENYSRWL